MSLIVRGNEADRRAILLWIWTGTQDRMRKKNGEKWSCGKDVGRYGNRNKYRPNMYQRIYTICGPSARSLRTAFAGGAVLAFNVDSRHVRGSGGLIQVLVTQHGTTTVPPVRHFCTLWSSPGREHRPASDPWRYVSRQPRATSRV
jgi:hypothetical protein